MNRLRALSSWSGRLAWGWLALVAAAAVLAPALPLPYPPAVPDLAAVAVPPGGRHWLGTDPLGRDVLAAVVFGARRVVLVSVPAAALAALLGAVAGGAAGYWGNRGLRLPAAAWLGALGLVWGVLDLPGRPVAVPLFLGAGLLAAPQLFGKRFSGAGRGWAVPLDGLVLGLGTLLGAVPRLALVVALAAGPPLGPGALLGLLALSAWPEPARLVRAQMLRVRELPFVEAARAAGLPPGRVWWRHALPHACQPLRTALPLSVAGLVGLESTLAFLGVGQPPDVASWGQVLGTVRQEPGAWWLVAAPGLVLLSTLLALQRLARPA